ncbi:MAG: ChaB family protein [Geodermatophilaceae bacterium]|nr:ChaB family protein [Geodermatophilaceae bacterium]
MPAKKDLPSTLQRSRKKAQETWAQTYDSAVEQYGEGERAYRTAYSALKHTHEKVGDHWEEKDHKGPSDPQAAQSGRASRERPRSTYGGVDGNATKAHLLEIAARLEIRGRSRMSKSELITAIDKANRRETAAAREG